MASTQSEGISADEARQLFETHEYLRTWRWWLGLLGLLLLGWIVRLVAAYPTRTPLAGYRYRQVGVQAGKPRLWWVLAYRGSRAELLFSTDTSRGWQRHELGVDSSQARGLALDWGGRALLVGDSGAVRVYDSLFRPIGPARKLENKWSKVRWLAADGTGQRAEVSGDNKQIKRTSDGGKTWDEGGHVDELDRSFFDSQRQIDYVAFKDNYLSLTSRPVDKDSTFADLPNWYRPLRYPIVGLGLNPSGDLLAVDQRGTWVTKSRVDSTSNKFTGRLLGAAWVPDSAGKFLAITATQIFWGKISKQLLAPASPAPPAASASKPAANKPQASALAATVPKKARPKPATQPVRRPQKSPASRQTPVVPPAQQKPASEPPSQGGQPTQSPVQNPVQQSSPQNQVPSKQPSKLPSAE